MKELTPSMLKPGKHLVKLGDNEWYLVIEVDGQLIASNTTGYANITGTRGDEFCYESDTYEIHKVATLLNARGTNCTQLFRPGGIIWEKGQPTSDLEPFTFSKKDLVPGKHIVRLHDGKLSLLLQTAAGSLFASRHDAPACNKWFNYPLEEDMSCDGNPQCTIDEVYEIIEVAGLPTLMEKCKPGLKLVYQRTPPARKVTMSEVIAEFGHPVEVITGE